MTEDVTADFIYVRLHGDKELYRSGYSDRALSRWAQRIRAWHGGSPAMKPLDVYCYFDNTDVKLRAPVDAQSLMRKLAIAWEADRDGGERIPPNPPVRCKPASCSRCRAGTSSRVR